MDSDQGKNSIRPDFLKESEVGRTSKKRERVSNAAADLASLEQGASADIGRTEDSLSGARANEEAANGFYSGSGKFGSGKAKGKGRGKGFFKKRGPIVTVMMLLLGVGGLAGGSQLFQPFSLLEQFRETFNSMQTATNTRSNRFFRMQMDSGRVKDPIKARIFRTDTFKITNSQAKELSVQGIYYDDNFEGTGTRVLKFDDGTGELKIVTADNASATKLKNSLDLGNLVGDSTLNMKYNVEPISFANLYASNTDFFYGYNKGSMTWRGAISNWFGTTTVNFLSSNKLTRSLFKNWQEEVTRAGKGNTRQAALDLIGKQAAGTDTNGGLDGGKPEEEIEEIDTDGDGEADETRTDYERDNHNEIEYFANKDSSLSNTKALAKAEAEAQLKNFAARYSGLNSASGIASAGSNAACLIFSVIGGVGTLVMANEVLQIINLTTSYFEAIDKVRAGDGDASPIHELTTALNERKEIEYDGIVANGNGADLNSEDSIIAAFDETKEKTNGSAMESSGIAALYGGGTVNPNDASVKSFNVMSSLSTIMSGLGLSMASATGCSIAKLTTAAIDTAIDVFSIASCVVGVAGAAFTFGASITACLPALANTLGTIAVSAVASAVIGGVISVIIPWFANTMTRDLISNIGGEDLGNALTSGANMYMGNTHRTNGGSLATESEYIAFASEQQRVIAENAEYERASKSPFDASSQYTFLGTLLTQLMAFSTSNSLMSTLSSGASVISSSVTSLMPTSSAIDIADHLYTAEEYEEICPYLASIGAVGDAYCNPYTITDMSTMDIDPADVADKLSTSDNNGLGDNFLDETTEDGNVIIDGSSGLARYIVYCSNRTSAFGVADQNIAGTVADFANVNTGSSLIDNAANGAIGAIPIIGDGVDIVQNSQQLAWAGYISGESCVAGNNVGGSAPDWETAQYYQRFIEDQSLAESMGLIEESAVTAYLNDYYEENPLDQSYEGILARYSGLEKEDVVALLTLIEYETYISNYDPSTRYSFVEVEEDSENIIFEENQFEQVIGLSVYAVVYTDLRNRNYVA